MQLRFLGHAAFSLQFDGARLCLDPHRPGAVGGRFALPPIEGPFDVIAVSHAHEDHCGWTPALGTDHVIDADADFAGFSLRFRPVFHDKVGGVQMGLSQMIKITAGDTTIVHCGDIGGWDDEDLAWLQGVDLLLVPVGGTFTVNGKEAAELVALTKPRWVVPMHAADPRVDLNLAPTSDFLAACPRPTVALSTLDLDDPPADGATLLLQSP